MRFKESNDIESGNYGFYKSGCKDFEEVDEVAASKTEMLNKLIENDPGEVAKFGARHPTLGYAVMKPVNHKHCNKSRIYYYIKYDGYKSDRGTQKEVFAWMRANREYHGE